MGRALSICVAFIVVVLIGVAVTLGLVFGLKKHEKIPDLSTSVIYSNTKETELMDINGTRVFGVKDLTGNVQAVHAIQTPNTFYILDNDLLTQIHSSGYTLVFNYNDTSSEYYVMLNSENSSYEIPSLYITPTVKFPEFEFNIPMDVNISNPYTGVVIELEDDVSQQLISDASLQLNYEDEQYGNRSVVMINTGGGRYYALLPTNDTEMDKYFKTENLYETISQQSNSLIELVQVYPIADICSKVPQAAKSFCDEISEDIRTKIPDALRTASKYADRIPLKSESSSSLKSRFEIEVRMPDGATMRVPLDGIPIDPSDLTVISRKVKSSKGKCNEQTVAGGATPDDRQINIGRGHVTIKFHYETYTVKDKIDVSYTNKTVFSSGCVGTDGERVTPIQLDDNEANFRVIVTPNCAGGTQTEWYYAIECPNQDLVCSAFSCSCGLKQKPSRQVTTPIPDGCGTHRTKWNYKIIHGIGELFKFTPVCNDHDVCYGTCNTNRAGCDLGFCAKLTASCLINWGILPPVFEACVNWSIIFCGFVAALGSGAFENAQNEDCWCDTTSLWQEP